MNTVGLERGLTEYLGEVLGLETDKGIFRGGLPYGSDGLGVLLGAEMPRNGIDVPMYPLSVIGRFEDRDFCKQSRENLVCEFPKWGIALAGGFQADFVVQESEDIFMVSADGKIKYCFELKIMVSARS